MARYMPDFPVGNGRFENLNPVPIVEYMEPASSRTQSIEEQVRNQVELQLSSHELSQVDDEEEDFDIEDDEYEIPEDEWPDYVTKEVKKDVENPAKDPQDRKEPSSPQDAGGSFAATTEAAGAAEGVSTTERK